MAKLTEYKLANHRWGLARSRDYTEIPQELIDAVEGLTEHGIRKKCGCGRKAAAAILERRQLPSLVVDELTRNALHVEDGSLRIRMQNIISGPGEGTRIVMTKLKALAQIVQDYRTVFKYNREIMQPYVFPPKSLIRQMAEAIESAYALFVRMHNECPEFDSLIFYKARSLYRQITGEKYPEHRKRGRPKTRKTKKKPRPEPRYEDAQDLPT